MNTNHEIEYEIEIAQFNSGGIRHEAKIYGATHMRFIGGGYPAGREGLTDCNIDFYALQRPNGGEFRVADTNGDPLWEEEDIAGFAELAESCGVDLT